MSHGEIENRLKNLNNAESEKLMNLIDETTPEFEMDTELTQADIDRICPRQAD